MNNDMFDTSVWVMGLLGAQSERNTLLNTQ
jgi:hypothetical protein